MSQHPPYDLPVVLYSETVMQIVFLVLQRILELVMLFKLFAFLVLQI